MENLDTVGVFSYNKHLEISTVMLEFWKESITTKN